MAEYERNNPTPPKKPRSAYLFYKLETNGHKNVKDWKTEVSDEEKAPFQQKSKEDKEVRYQKELQEFKDLVRGHWKGFRSTHCPQEEGEGEEEEEC